MSNNLIDLNALSEFKTRSDLKYQDKLTASGNISLNNNVASVTPTVADVSLGTKSVANSSVTNVGSLTLSPGNYYLMFTCDFASNATGYRQCGFSTSSSTITGFGTQFCDSRKAANGVNTMVQVVGIFNVSASSYPNGRTFYFTAKQNCGKALNSYPRYYYYKFG